MYDKLRDHRHWVLPEVLAFQAAHRRDKAYVTLTSGETMTYGAAHDDALRVAGFLAALGVRPGDTVAVMMPNGFDYIRTWLGLGRLGAVLVALNTDLKGSFLEHQVKNCGAKVAVFHASFLPALGEIADRLADLHTVVVAGDAVPAEAAAGAAATSPCSPARRWRTAGFEGWRDAPAYDGPLPSPKDIGCIIYTSGTTGPSKGVLMPHAHCYLFGLGIIDNHAMTEQDVYYCVMPLFHVNGLYMQLYATLIAGATAILRQRFSATSWLDDVRRFGVTFGNLLGAMSAFVFAQPPSPHDRDHRLRIVQTAPNPPEHDRIWRERFGVREVLSGFGMTECNIACYSEMGKPRPGTCGKPYSRYFEVEIHDPDTDELLPPDSIGEIVVRSKVPFGFMAGYHGMPEKTVEAWRNFWFHTGDAGRMDVDGYLTFIDRMKDCIRRRGENISSFEVEKAIARLPGVAEVAAFAVPSEIEGAEEEVMLAVVPAAGSALDIESILRHAERELPRFAQPRFIELVDALPKTPTAKVQKAKLRDRGVGPATWDRQKAAGRSASGR